jgi:integrase
MAGSMRERTPGVWELRVHLGRDARGKVKQVSRTFRGQKRAAERELARLVTEVEDGDIGVRPAPAGRGWALPTSGPDEPHPDVGTWGPETTINDAIKDWQLNGWDDLSPSTVIRYKSIWKSHVNDSIGKAKIVELGPYDVEQFFRALKRQGLGARSVQQTRALLHRACRLARKWSGNRLPNPIADTELPDWSLDERRPDVRAPSVAEVVALLTAARAYDDRMGVFVRLTAATGARRGEMCALRWSDIDWDHGAVRIDESAVMIEGGVRIKAPKTRKSVRLIAIDKASVVELRRYHTAREELASVAGVALEPDGFVFSTEPSGARLPYPDTFSQAFAKIRSKAKVADDVHLHSLRHFHSTQLPRDPGGPEAGPPGVGDRPHGSPLHRRHHQGRPQGG